MFQFKIYLNKPSRQKDKEISLWAYVEQCVYSIHLKKSRKFYVIPSVKLKWNLIVSQTNFNLLAMFSTFAHYHHRRSGFSYKKWILFRVCHCMLNFTFCTSHHSQAIWLIAIIKYKSQLKSMCHAHHNIIFCSFIKQMESDCKKFILNAMFVSPSHSYRIEMKF